jgi:YebC/PmpR family DNA-binding regulatory protein
MSGHSKWATTKHKKEARDAKRAGAFTRLSRNISLAARQGGDPDTNFTLRLAIEKAREGNMPKDNIEKAIKKGTGELDGATIEELLLEAYAVGGVALIIEVITDNKNRTIPELKAILSKAGGSMAGANSVKWMFERKGVIRLSLENVADKDNLILSLLDAGASDAVEEDRGLTIYCAFEDFEKLRQWLEANSHNPSYAEMEWVAKDKVEVDEQIREKVEALIETLEDNDDVNSVFSNLK